MWTLANNTPYAADRTWVRDKAGCHIWAIAVKATYQVAADGALSLADEQLPAVSTPEFFSEPYQSSMRFESDLSLPKPTTDITVNGSAHAPGGKPAPSVPVSVRVGPVHKALMVFGERVYYQGAAGLTTTAPAPFVTKTIRYEGAFGGTDAIDPDPRRHVIDMRNPLGRGTARQASSLAHRPAHHIEFLHGEAARSGPAGFGAIPSTWSPRREHAGTYDAIWAENKKPFLPDDYDSRFEQSAPLDQRAPTPLHGGELVEIVHMTPEGVLRCALPKVLLTFTTYFGSRKVDHRAMMASVIIEPDDRRLMVVWQSHLPVKARDCDYLDRTLLGEKRYVR